MSSKAIVYFSEELEGILPLLDKIKAKRIGIKVHFGEKGNNTFIDAGTIRKIYERIKKNNPESKISLVECNVLYKSERSETKPHLKIAREHGFDMPVDILDNNGDKEIQIQGKHFKKIYLGRGIDNYDVILAVSHVKGHLMTGFAGAIKNIGMGLASRKGKLALHSSQTPEIDKEKCLSCGKCKEECPANAISINGRAEIDIKKCIACAHCINVCPNEAIRVPWASLKSDELQERIVEYASGLKNKPIFAINVLKNITKDCDCFGVEMKKEAEDIGFLFSDDIVAVDRASYDLIEQGLFEKLHPGINARYQFEYAEKIGIGSQRYKLEKIK